MALTGQGPRVNEPRLPSLTYCAMLLSPKPDEPGTVYERMPRRTAISTAGFTPTCCSNLTKAVLGDSASACVIDIDAGYLPSFLTQ
ncbi:Uncharacterised protein [Mycobacteroides abscessus subsp. abscessus]|nr:Uncharacterised protein [Mycobacteroides abscessus subsp. abscessus]